MAKRAKQTGPYTVKWQGSLGYGRGEPTPSLEAAVAERDALVEQWKGKGYEQVRPERGGHFYSNGRNWKSVSIVGSDDRYVKGV